MRICHQRRSHVLLAPCDMLLEFMACTIFDGHETSDISIMYKSHM